MKKKHIAVRLFAILLSLILLCSLAVSCASSGAGNKDRETKSGEQSTNNQQGSQSETVKPEDETVWYEPAGSEGKPYEGQTFRMIVNTDDSSVYWHDSDFTVAADLTGDTYEDAVYQRQYYLQERTGVTIEIDHDPRSSDGTFQTFINAILGGTDNYHAGNVSTHRMFAMATQGLLQDVNTMSSLQKDAPWWDQNVYTDLSIAGHVFGMYGDIGMMARRTLAVIIFNKAELQVRFPNLDLYEVQDQGKWTIDYMTEIVENAAQDLNGDDAMGDDDFFGLVYQTDMTPIAFICADVRFVTKDADDLPELSFNDDRTLDVLDALSFLMYNTDVARSSDSVEPKLGIRHGDAFRSGHSLFDSTEVHSVVSARVMEADYGVLCMPKYDEEQSHYITCINPHVAATLVIPYTNLEEEFTSYMLDELGAAGRNYLLPAFYDIVLTGRSVRDEESKATLDLVMENVRYELGYLASWGVSELMRKLGDNRSMNFASEYKSAEFSIETKMKQTVDAITAND